MVTVREVSGKKDIKAFIELPLEMYKGNPSFVPPLYLDERALFKPNNTAYIDSSSKFFLAEKDGKVVGRIQVILQRKSNEIRDQKRIRISRFDFIDDLEVSKALLDAAKNYALENGMDSICGPLGFNDMDREGLLVEGFEEESTFEEQYNAPYYEKHYLAYGFETECEWVESRLTAPEKFDDRMIRIADKMMNRLGLHVAENKNLKELLARYADKIFDLYEKAYSVLYMAVPVPKAQQDEIISAFKLLLTPDYVRVIVDKDDNVVAFGLVFPTIGRHLQKKGGRLTPSTIIKVLKEVKHPKGLDLGLIGVREDYANTGIAWALARLAVDKLVTGEIEYCDTNLNMVDNLQIRNMWKYFTQRENKRRRSYVVKIAE